DATVDAGHLLHHLADAAGQLGPLGLALGMDLHQQDDFPTLFLLDGEGAGIAAAQVLQRLDRPFDVLRPDVAAVDDDEVLGPAGDDELAIAPVAEIAGIEPSVGQGAGAFLHLAEIASHDAAAAHEQPTYVALAERVAGVAACLDAIFRHRAAAKHELASTAAVSPEAAGPATEAQADTDF